MAKIVFTQKEISGSPISGVEFDRYIMQSDNQALVGGEVLSFDKALNEVSEIPSGLNNEVLMILAGLPVFSGIDKSNLMAQKGHIEMRNGLIINYDTISALSATLSAISTHSKPFTSINLGSFISVVDPVNLVQVSTLSETLLDVTVKNFDALNSAATIRIFSIGI